MCFLPEAKSLNDISLKSGLAFRCWQLVHLKKNESATLLVTHHSNWTSTMKKGSETLAVSVSKQKFRQVAEDLLSSGQAW